MGAHRDLYSLGMSKEQLRELRNVAKQKGLRDPYIAFGQQINGARARGIEWRLTFAEWWDIWKDYYHLRGTGKNGLCMARFGDVGAYEAGNVYLTTNLGNRADYFDSHKYADWRSRRNLNKRRYWGKQHSGDGRPHAAFENRDGPPGLDGMSKESA